MNLVYCIGVLRENGTLYWDMTGETFNMGMNETFGMHRDTTALQQQVSTTFFIILQSLIKHLCS